MIQIHSIEIHFIVSHSCIKYNLVIFKLIQTSMKIGVEIAAWFLYSCTVYREFVFGILKNFCHIICASYYIVATH